MSEKVCLGKSRYHRVAVVDGARYMACQAGQPWRLLITMERDRAEACGYRACSRCYPTQIPTPAISMKGEGSDGQEL